MAEDQWLWNQPKTWHEIDRALQDVSVLLQYLGQMPEGRLLGYFADTQNRVADGASKKTVPPCATYPEFLNRLFEISSAFQTGRLDPIAEAPAGSGQAPLSAAAFVFWSRDFLAAVAAPATADSIRLTRDYMIRRARNRGWLHLWRRTRRKPQENAPALPPLLPDADDETRQTLARRLARWVMLSETITIAAVALTVAVSIYALSGRLILDNAIEVQAAWARMDAQLELQEDKFFPSPTLPISEAVRKPITGLCEMEATVPDGNTGPFASARNPHQQIDAEPASAEKPELRTIYIYARQAHLCADRAKLLRDLFTVTMHLQSWSSVVTQRLGRWRIRVWNVDLPLGMPVAPLFGVVPASLSDYAKESGGRLCQQVAPEIFPANGKDQLVDGACEQFLWTLINRSRNVAQSILGSITQYLLPVCYGFLGAMAASLRLIRRKVDASLLCYTDRARLQQGAILGILCGGVIGLFASYLGNTDPASGLGLSALALLAGYNVDGVFRFLDELSDRIFRPSEVPRA